MATSLYTYQPFHTIGAATLQLWDASAGGGAGGWVSAGRIADAAVSVATEQVAKEVITAGLSQPVARRNRAKRYSLGFRLLENASPQLLGILYGDGAEQSTAAGGAESTAEVLRLYGEDYSALAHPYGIDPLAPPVIRSYDGLITYVKDVDYETDLKKGLVKRIESGSIPEGAAVYVTYSYTQPAGVSTSLGDVADLEPYRKVRLLQLSIDNTDPDSSIESGLEFEFYRVNVSAADSTIPFSAEDYSEGASISWDCLYDPAQGKVGTVRSSFGVLANY